jgi:type IV secretory pathway VirJ component
LLLTVDTIKSTPSLPQFDRQPTSKMLISELSEEAKVLRRLVLNYVADKLRQNDLAVPTSLQAACDVQTNADQAHLMHVFTYVVDLFVHEHGLALQTLLSSLPASVGTVEEAMEVTRIVLMQGDVSWGRVVAVTAFTMKIALRCVQNELDEAVLPLIDRVAMFTDQTLAMFIRGNGGWVGFAVVFSKLEESRRGGSWLFKALKVIGTVASFVKPYI